MTGYEPPFQLTLGERQSPLLRKLMEHYAKKLETYRGNNDNVNLSPEQTAHLRGRIAECKSFLALDNPAPTVMNDAS